MKSISFDVPASSVICAKWSESVHKSNRQWKVENNCNIFSFGLWEETDTICYFEKKKGILKESEILIVMRKGGWQKNTWLNGWENPGQKARYCFEEMRNDGFRCIQRSLNPYPANVENKVSS